MNIILCISQKYKILGGLFYFCALQKQIVC